MNIGGTLLMNSNSVYGLEDWVEICEGIEVNEMRFSHDNREERRYILVRKQVDLRPKAGGKLLFEDMPGYRYVLVQRKMDFCLI